MKRGVVPMSKNIVAASILSADLCSLGEDIDRAQRAGADYLHFDVMDGVFVNNISYGIPVLDSVRKYTDMFLDVHLMITEPVRYVGRFAEYGADMITFHLEAARDVKKTIDEIKKTGRRAGIALKPATPFSEVIPYFADIDMLLIMTVEPGFGGQGLIPETIDKLREAKRYADEHGIFADIEVDGGINGENAAMIRKAGANVLVAGSYIFKSDDITASVKALRG